MNRFDIFWFFVIFIGKCGVFCMILIPLQLEMDLHLICTIILAALFAKIEYIKVDLENKIFELKEIIENGGKKN